MDMIKKIIEDTREIRQLQLGIGEGSRFYTVDDDEYTLFTKIVPYLDARDILCFAIYTGEDEPTERVQFNGFVTNIVYFKD